mmetsp:Transcript_68517/g.150712  ORF Transcript_68517/g.150712 Transcript_68517/m.150712 type:complete len:81 (-) Transcript_68517:176-418(-)
MSAKNLFEQLLQLVQPTKLGFVACLAQRSGCKAISILPWKIGVAILLFAFCWMLKAGIPGDLQKPQSVCDCVRYLSFWTK